MKKILALFLVLVLLASVLTCCGDSNRGNNGDTSNSEAESSGYEYLFRDLPEAKYITPATDFSGGDGSESNPYQISNVAELVLMHEKMVDDSENLKSNYSRSYYVLTADIAVNDISDFDKWGDVAPEYSWMPIGFETTGFKGVLDGNGYTISGLYINANNDEWNKSYGLFDTVDGTVKNVKIDKSYFAVSGKPCYVGSIAGCLGSEAVIDNCESNALLYCYDTTCGGLVGISRGSVGLSVADKDEETEAKYSAVSNCSFAGVIMQVKNDAMSFIGGIVGSCSGNIDTCVNKGTINFAGNNVDSVGGIAGRMSEGTMSGCKNTGAINSEPTDGGSLAIAGGLVGKIFVSATGSEKGMSRGVKLTKCENIGTVSGQMYAGGIAGELSNDHNDYCVTVSECVNSGIVTSKDYTGGIIGCMNCLGDNINGDNIVIENCENKADLSKGTVGGIIAKFMSEKGNVKIRGCENSANLTSEGQNCAGIIAYWIMNSNPSDSSMVIDSCKNTGDIYAPLKAGGIIGFMDMPVCLEIGDNVSVSVLNCINDGKVTANQANGYIGGILGNWGMENVATLIENCTNNGTLSIIDPADNMTDDDAKIMTVSRIVGGIVGRVGPGLLLTTDSDNADNKNIQSKNAVLKITNSKNTGKVDVTNVNAENYKNWFGGIIGNTCGEDGFSVFVENCTYTGFERGLGNEELTDIGTEIK